MKNVYGGKLKPLEAPNGNQEARAQVASPDFDNNTELKKL